MKMEFDREYYIAAICEKYACADDIDVDDYFAAVDRAIDKTLEVYTKNGNLLVEDWDMFDQELDTNVFNELTKLEEDL